MYEPCRLCPCHRLWRSSIVYAITCRRTIDRTLDSIVELLDIELQQHLQVVKRFALIEGDISRRSLRATSDGYVYCVPTGDWVTERPPELLTYAFDGVEFVDVAWDSVQKRDLYKGRSEYLLFSSDVSFDRSGRMCLRALESWPAICQWTDCSCVCLLSHEASLPSQWSLGSWGQPENFAHPQVYKGRFRVYLP